MFGNGKIFVSHAHSDNQLCQPLLAALDAWEVDYWFDLQELQAGQQFSEKIQQALSERDIFIRICTPATAHSYWLSQELAVMRALQTSWKQQKQGDERLLIFLVLAPGYVADPLEPGEIMIDATNHAQTQWLHELRQALKVPIPDQRVNRRAFLGLGIAGGAAIAAAGGAGFLYLTRKGGQAAGIVPTTHGIVDAPTPQASANRVRWFFKQYTDFSTFPIIVTDKGVATLGNQGLYLLNPTDGSIIWNQLAADPNRPSTSYSGNIVAGPDAIYATAEDGKLYALSTTDGTKLWGIPVPDLNKSGPVYAAGQVFYSVQGQLLAVNATTGQQQWSKTLVAGSSSKSAPYVSNGIVYVGQDDAKLYALNAATGAILWTFQAKDTFEFSPYVSQGIVFLNTQFASTKDKNLYALDAKTGTARWQQPFAASMVSSPFAQNGTVYVKGTDDATNGATLFALDANSGKIQWKGQYGQHSDGNIIDIRPVIVGTTIYITGAQEAGYTLYAMSATDGTLLWNYMTNGNGLSHGVGPVASGNLIFFGGSDNAIYALSTQ